MMELQIGELGRIPRRIALLEGWADVVGVVSGASHVRPMHLLVRVNVDRLVIPVSGHRGPYSLVPVVRVVLLLLGSVDRLCPPVPRVDHRLVLRAVVVIFVRDHAVVAQVAAQRLDGRIIQI